LEKVERSQADLSKSVSRLTKSTADLERRIRADQLSDGIKGGAIASVRGPHRLYRRHKKGLCLKYGYNLTGNVNDICPECGTGIDPTDDPTFTFLGSPIEFPRWELWVAMACLFLGWIASTPKLHKSRQIRFLDLGSRRNLQQPALKSIRRRHSAVPVSRPLLEPNVLPFRIPLFGNLAIGEHDIGQNISG